MQRALLGKICRLPLYTFSRMPMGRPNEFGGDVTRERKRRVDEERVDRVLVDRPQELSTLEEDHLKDIVRLLICPDHLKFIRRELDIEYETFVDQAAFATGDTLLSIG